MKTARMKNIIVGTAGHIDHGKTALVKALTGTDADRLAEEKRRGITIDLGFAHLQLSPDIRIGFIDVPGHERFVRNMLAGAAGIDVVLFVISAAESIKPQTREHFEICRLLGVQHGVIALTKSDLMDPELLDLARLEADEFVRGSFLENAPKIAVSSTTGVGLDELRAALESTARKVQQKKSSGWFRLPLDRAFTIKGFGTVVTGTLISGTVRPEQEVAVYPGGRRLRVRGIQVYGAPASHADAGERTAFNLPGIEPGEIHRGMVLSEPGRFTAVTNLDCEIQLLASARPMKNRAPVHFHLGTMETEAQVRFLDGRSILEPGHSTWARIVLKEPTLAFPGDRFIVRMISPVITIGGGVVADVSAHHYRSGQNAAARLRALTPERLVLESEWGVSRAQLTAWTGLREFPAMPDVEPAGEWLVSKHRIADARRALVEHCRAFHKAHSLLKGIPKPDLKTSTMLGASDEVFEHALAGAKELVQDADVVRLATHCVVLREDETLAREAIETSFAKAGLAAPEVAEVLKSSGVEPARAKSILQMLLREGKLLRISNELVLDATALTRLRTELAGKRGKRFSVPVFKEWTGVSRKYAIPLLEYLDREHVTRREGDERVLL
jgi:selenocysteine-specific elongation factor